MWINIPKVVRWISQTESRLKPADLKEKPIFVKEEDPYDTQTSAESD